MLQVGLKKVHFFTNYTSLRCLQIVTVNDGSFHVDTTTLERFIHFLTAICTAIVRWLSHVCHAFAYCDGRRRRGEWKLLHLSRERTPNLDDNARFESPQESIFLDPGYIRWTYDDGLLYTFYVRPRYRITFHQIVSFPFLKASKAADKSIPFSPAIFAAFRKYRIRQRKEKKTRRISVRFYPTKRPVLKIDYAPKRRKKPAWSILFCRSSPIGRHRGLDRYVSCLCDRYRQHHWPCRVWIG